MSTKVDTQGVNISYEIISSYINSYNLNRSLWNSSWVEFPNFSSTSENSQEMFEFTFNQSCLVPGEYIASNWNNAYFIDEGAKLYRITVPGFTSIVRNDGPTDAGNIIFEVTTSDGSINNRHYKLNKLGFSITSAQTYDGIDSWRLNKDMNAYIMQFFPRGTYRKPNSDVVGNIDLTLFVCYANRDNPNNAGVTTDLLVDQIYLMLIRSGKGVVTENFITSGKSVTIKVLNNTKIEGLGNETFVGKEIDSNNNIFKSIKTSVINMMNRSGGSKFFAYNN